MKSLSEPFEIIIKHYFILRQTTISDIRGRFAGSVLGMLWLVFYPLLLLGSYSILYVFIFKIRLELLNPIEFVAYIFCGLIPYIGFSEALGAGVPSVVANSKLIKNTLFPIELIPVKAVLVSQSTQIPGMGMLLIALIVLDKLGPWSLLLPVVWFSQILFSIGLIWMLSSLNVYFRDLQSIVPVVSIMLLFVTPIAWTQDLVPETLRPFLKANPLYFFVRSYQDLLINNKFPSDGNLRIAFGIGLAFFLVGFWFFSKMKNVFADNI